jgi:molybdopterin converting factor small subunit
VRVEVRLFATLERYLPDSAEGDRATLDLPDDATVADVARCLRVPDDLSFLVVVNGHEAPSDRRLHPGDVVVLFPPLAGGAASATREGR